MGKGETVGKRENLGYQHVLLFPVFQKPSSSGSLKSGLNGKQLSLYQMTKFWLLTKLKVFADKKLNVAERMISV